MSSRAVAVGDSVLEADRIFINTGGRPVIPSWAGLADVPYLTNTTLLELDWVPQHLVIAGGSYIGLEFARMYRRFGARVTVVEYADRLIAREDEDLSRAVQDILAVAGIAFHLGVRDVALSRASGGVRLTARAHGEPITVEGSHLLLAVGRRPNTESLDA